MVPDEASRAAGAAGLGQLQLAMARTADGRPILRTKRVYLPPEASDGQRILVDRLWPRGLGKDKAAVDLWLKDVAPSDALRKWFHHEVANWDEFRRRYEAELEHNPAVAQLRAAVAARPSTLLYGAKDEAHNQAVVLADWLAKHKP
jgi:uncharacterized protein YeaO (DUF488 family)